MQSCLPVLPTQSPPLKVHPAVFLIEPHGPIDFAPTHYVDISPVIEEKSRILALHTSQEEAFNKLGKSIGKFVQIASRFRGDKVNCEHAEAFVSPCRPAAPSSPSPCFLNKLAANDMRNFGCHGSAQFAAPCLMGAANFVPLLRGDVLSPVSSRGPCARFGSFKLFSAAANRERLSLIYLMFSLSTSRRSVVLIFKVHLGNEIALDQYSQCGNLLMQRQERSRHRSCRLSLQNADIGVVG